MFTYKILSICWNVPGTSTLMGAGFGGAAESDVGEVVCGGAGGPRPFVCSTSAQLVINPLTPTVAILVQL